MPQLKREAVERILQGYIVIVPQEGGYLVAYPEFEYITITQVASREELEELLGRARFRGVRGVCIGQRLECTEVEVEGHHVVDALYVAEAY